MKAAPGATPRPAVRRCVDTAALGEDATARITAGRNSIDGVLALLSSGRRQLAASTPAVFEIRDRHDVAR